MNSKETKKIFCFEIVKVCKNPQNLFVGEMIGNWGHPALLHNLDNGAHVLLHLVKSSCPNSVNPFSTLFSADIQHNCPILFCICWPYFPPWLAFRFSIKKWLHLHFQGKWPLLPSSFGQLSFSLRFALPINKAKPYQWRFRTFLLTWFGMVVSSLHAVYIHFANKNKLKMSMQLSKNMIKKSFYHFL